MHNASSQLTDSGQATLTGPGLLQREDFSRALLDHLLQALGFRGYTVVQLGRASRFFLELPSELRLDGDVAFDRHGTANLAVLVVERIRVDLDDDLSAVRSALHRERLAANALATQRTSGRMFVHEKTGSVDRARTVELPQLAQRGRLSRGMVV